MKKVIFTIIVGWSLFGFWNGGVVTAEEAGDRRSQAERYVSDGEIDFAFMEYQAILREFPDDPLALEALFACGEYYFREHNSRETVRAFELFRKKSSEGIPHILALVYLLKGASFLKDSAAARDLEERLKEALSSSHFFAAFEENQKRDWSSPLGNHYELNEFVDHMDILLNGEPFYTIHLS